ncbi:MAG TPA: hypothetical protein VI728_07675, partial [Syntrophales bacterium]|nr:hypothetical protein [Syntrophales bacterium]
MFTFCECLYQAWLFTSPEQTRYDLKYVCLEKDAIYGVSGSRLYQGFPDDNPWESFTPDKLGRIFLKPQEKPSLKGDGRLDIKGKIVALGTEWKISNSVPFPPTKKILEIYTPEQFFPVDKREWERMIRFRSIFADPVCKISIYMIEQDRGNLIATPV